MKELNSEDIVEKDVDNKIEETVETPQNTEVTVESEDALDKEENTSMKKIKMVATKVFDALMNIVLAASVLVIIFSTFLGSFHNISGSSMDTTLADGDQIISINSLKSMEHGDIVIASPKQMNDRMIIKRVIAFEGDTIRIDAGEVYVNGEKLQEEYVDVPSVEDVQPEVKVPEGHVWIMGDNRNHSTDSRSIGFVAIDDIEGIAFARISPIDNFEFLK